MINFRKRILLIVFSEHSFTNYVFPHAPKSYLINCGHWDDGYWIEILVARDNPLGQLAQIEDELTIHTFLLVFPYFSNFF